MADLTAEQIKALNDEAAKTHTTFDQLISKVKSGAASLTNLTGVAGSATIGFEHLQNFLSRVGDGMKGVGKDAEIARLAFMGVAGATMAARDSFRGLAGVDYSNMNTLSDQMKQLHTSLNSGGTAAGIATTAISGMFNKFKDKMPDSAFSAITAAGPKAMMTFVENMAIKADNMTRMQGGILALSAATGNLGDVHKKAGGDLSNMNAVLLSHQNSIRATISATRQAPAEVEKYYMALGHVPGALEAVVSSGTAAGGNMNMLTAVMKMAAGNGREVAAVTNDMKAAFKSFNMPIKDTLVFVNNFSDLSSNLGIELDDIKQGLMGAADAFKNITNAGAESGKMVLSLRDDMNTMVGGLKQFGMTGQHATQVYADMQKGMAGMTTAQKAYVSAQTGGPGGLLGAAEIDKMMLSGDVVGMKKKMMDTLKKQIGPIMDISDVKDQASAAKFERQKMMMTQGPLGSALGIKDPMDAIKMSAMLKAEASGGLTTKKLSEGGDRGLQDAIGKGTAIENQNNTELTEANITLNDIATSTDFMAHVFAKSNFGAEKDMSKGGTGKVSDLAAFRLARADKASQEGGKVAQDRKEQMGRAGGLIDSTGETHQKIVKDFLTWGDHLKDVFGSITKPFQDALKGGDQKKIATENEKLQQAIAQKKEAGQTSEAEALEKYRAQGMDLNSAALKPEMYKTRKPTKFAEAQPAEPLTPGQQVAQSKHGTPAPKKPGAGGELAPGSYTHSVTENGAETGTKIHVTVKVDKTSDNARSVSPVPRP